MTTFARQPESSPPFDPWPSADARAAPPSGPAIQRRSFLTESLEEARVIFSQVYSSADVEPIAGHRFRCHLDVSTFGGVHTLRGDWAGGAKVTVPSFEGRYMIIIGVAGQAGAHLESSRHAVVPGERAVMLSPGPGTVVEIEPGSRGRSVVIDQAVLEAHLAMLTGRSRRGPIRFEGGLDFAASPSAAIGQLLQTFHGELERAAASPLLLSSVRSALLTSLLTNTHHSAAALFLEEPRRVAPASVRRAEEFIVAHAAEAISLSDIVNAVGVPARSLRAAFQASRGIGPSEFLRRCRFDLARRKLLEAAPGTTVASVVVELGLGGAGRFSVEYRRRFGERPSETLAAARMRSGRRA